jgi:hypothetical protein
MKKSNKPMMVRASKAVGSLRSAALTPRHPIS